MRGRFVDGVHVRKFLQCLQVADDLAVPVDPRFTALPELLVAVVVGVVLVESFNLGGGNVEC